MSDESLLNTVRSIIAHGQVCFGPCEDDEHEDCECADIAERIVALVAPAAAAAERERIRAAIADREAFWLTLAEVTSDRAGAMLYTSMAATANGIARACIDSPTSSEAGQALGCKSEGEASAPSSDNPST